MSAVSLTLSSSIPSYTREEIAKHATEGDAWVAISGKVYNLSTFNHPCGFAPLRRHVGKDATRKFEAMHQGETRKRALARLDADFFIGSVASNLSRGG